MFTRISQKPGTLRPVKKHGNERRSTLSKHTKRTLGSGNLRAAVALPPNEDRNEWLAANTVDFFNEISLLYGLVGEDAQQFSQPGEGFPPGFEYRWQAPGTDSKPMKCSSPDYVDYVMTWVEDQINNEEIFPIQESQPFPANFENYVRDIFKRLFRIFAIIYHRHFAVIEELEAAAHLNTCFKHFAFFCFEFNLVDEAEMKALKGPTDRMREEYDESND
jgi:MOB kinase activator 1